MTYFNPSGLERGRTVLEGASRFATPDVLKGKRMNIKGSVAIVTGAAGGIGRALALELAKRKAACVALVDQSEAVTQVAKTINELSGNTVAFGFSGDATDAEFRK